MDGRQKPTPQSTIDNDLNDEEIIDLTQIVEGADDPVIDLDDILERPEPGRHPWDQPAGTASPAPEAFAGVAPADASESADDAVIELTEMVSAPGATTEEPAEDAIPISDHDERDEELIDLLDVAATAEPGNYPPEPPTPSPALEDKGAQTIGEEATVDRPDSEPLDTAQAPTAFDVDDAFIDLESRAEAILKDPESDFNFETPVKTAENTTPDDGFRIVEDEAAMQEGRPVEPETGTKPADSWVEQPPPAEKPLAATIVTPLAPPEAPSATVETVALTEQQLSDCLERVIEKIYGEKIESLMIQAIEKTVKEEIAKIKKALLEDDDGMLG